MQPLDRDPLQPLWDKADEATANDDVAGLLYVWKALADKGVWQLCARIGEIYERGAPGVPKDTEQALTWYRKALFEGDDPVAHLGMGRAYFNGIGCARDFSAAVKHFNKAHAQDMREAAFYIGVMHYRGAGVERNLDIASRYLLLAAEASYPAAHAYLARLAWDRLRPLEALRWLLKGIALGTRLAKLDANDPRLLGISLKRK